MLHFVLVAECPRSIIFLKEDVSLISLKLLIFEEFINTKQARPFSYFVSLQSQYKLKLS